ncbi:unnamed protein product [Brassica rapa]|uniref:Sphingomyelin synthase-like domain-containing protein n=2 Tax=Brassica TaxID=3705 RepID=A0A3P6CL00_BRACM|nr:unnamed protein product [Brassica napus]CAG7908090.1 unnamed protein product [Brassica rapa]CDY18431.1 BnaA04g21560D [Brassica napus]VDD15220.1 unnamed protein product [Brassica rapa]
MFITLILTFRDVLINARGVHSIHRAGPTLQDLGFFLLPELGQERSYISETVFTSVFVSFFLWTFHPFILKSKIIYTVLIWCRVVAFLFVIPLPYYSLRVITFYSTQLPGPNYHCREILNTKVSSCHVPWPKNHLLFFLSLTRIFLFFVHTYQKYGTKRFIKLFGWLTALVQSLLIIASRKHYTVDVVVAWYKENHKLLNGNGADPADWTKGSQVNGKIDSNGVHTDNSMSGA